MSTTPMNNAEGKKSSIRITSELGLVVGASTSAVRRISIRSLQSISNLFQGKSAPAPASAIDEDDDGGGLLAEEEEEAVVILENEAELDAATFGAVVEHDDDDKDCDEEEQKDLVAAVADAEPQMPSLPVSQTRKRSELQLQMRDGNSGIFNPSARQGSKASVHRKPRGPSVDELATTRYDLDQAKSLVAGGNAVTATMDPSAPSLEQEDGGFVFEFVKQRAQSDPFPIYGSLDYFEDQLTIAAPALAAAAAASAVGTPAPPVLRKVAAMSNATDGASSQLVDVPSTVREDEEHDDDVFVREGAAALLLMNNATMLQVTRRRESMYRASATIMHRRESIQQSSNSAPAPVVTRAVTFATGPSEVFPAIAHKSSAGEFITTSLTPTASAHHIADDSLQAAAAAQFASSLSSATSNRLIEGLTTSPDFLRALSEFLLTYNMFMDSMSLLQSLVFRFDEETRAGNAEQRARTLYVLQRWVEEHWYEFESNEILLEAVMQFAEKRLLAEDETDGNCRALLTKLTTVRDVAQLQAARRRASSGNVTVHLDAEEEEEEEKDATLPKTLLRQASRLFMKLSKSPPVELAPNFSSQWAATQAASRPWHLTLTTCTLFTKLEFARQLTLFESKLFRKILPTEFIQHSTKQSSTPPASVAAMIKHFNTMSKLVSHSICLVTEMGKRAAVMRRWVKIAKELLKLNNFNAVFEIMAGFHSVAVHRLHKTKQTLPARARNVLEFLEEVTSRKNNYASYRALLNSASVPIQPAVPFIGAALADLSFLDMGHGANVQTQTNGDTLINFNKQKRVAQVLGVIKAFQDHRYLLEPVPELQAFVHECLEASTDVSDKEIYQLSLACEAYLHSSTSPSDFLADELATTTTAHHRKQHSRAGLFLLSAGGNKKAE